MKPLVFAISVLFLLSGCESRSRGLKIYSHPDLAKYGPFSHVCKMGDGRQYFAVLGSSGGTVFVNYTDNKIEEKDVQFFPGASSMWRECRSYNHPNGNTYVYVVTEGPDFKAYPGGIQIFKLKDSSVELVKTYIGNFVSAHTIFIDTNRGLAFVNGSRWPHGPSGSHEDHMNHLGGLRILDIKTDPENPRDIGYYNKSYTHDSYALGEVSVPPRWEYDKTLGQYKQIPAGKAYLIYLADIQEGFIRILDISEPSSPVLIDSVHTPLHNQGVSVHNLWASEDKKWLYATEETRGSNLLVYDITNPVRPRFVTAYRSENVADNSLIHNVIVKDKIAYCTWYKEGLRLIDISNPVHPKEFAFFDSSTRAFPETTERDAFHGNWSVDIDDRGLIMISDIEEGLFILRRTINPDR